MKIQILRPSDNWEALYIDGKLVAQNHSLSADEVADAITNDLEVFDSFDYDEDETDFEWGVEEGDTQVDKYKGKIIWTNGEGCPKEWPF